MLLDRHCGVHYNRPTHVTPVQDLCNVQVRRYAWRPSWQTLASIGLYITASNQRHRQSGCLVSIFPDHNATVYLIPHQVNSFIFSIRPHIGRCWHRRPANIDATWNIYHSIISPGSNTSTRPFTKRRNFRTVQLSGCLYEAVCDRIVNLSTIARCWLSIRSQANASGFLLKRIVLWLYTSIWRRLTPRTSESAVSGYVGTVASFKPRALSTLVRVVCKRVVLHDDECETRLCQVWFSEKGNLGRGCFVREPRLNKESSFLPNLSSSSLAFVCCWAVVAESTT